MKKKQVFISYYHGDKELASRIASLFEVLGMKVWIDFRDLQPGSFIARNIENGLTTSNYFVIIISARSVASHWVQRELAMAFDLSRDGRLTIIPVKADNVNMPLELRGLLYIDISESFETGTSKLADFVMSEDSPAATFFSTRMRGPARARACEERLLGLEIADMRFELSRRMTKDELGVIWFDTLGRKMDNDINPASTGVIATELIYRVQSQRKMDRLVRHLCRERPDFERE